MTSLAFSDSHARNRQRSPSRQFTTLIVAVAVSCLLPSILWAQNPVPAGINSPTYTLTDPNGVNLTSGKPTAQLADVAIGSKENRLTHTLVTAYEGAYQAAISFVDSYTGKLHYTYAWDDSGPCSGGSLALDVNIGGSAERMCGPSGGPYVAQRSTGSTLVSNGDGTLTYTQNDGAKFLFGTPGLLTRITTPDGRVTTLTYKSAVVSGVTRYRLQSVTRNDGLQLKYSYASNAPPTAPPPNAWWQVASVRAVNNAVDYCDPAADTCVFTQAWPIATQTWTTSGSLKYFTVVDSGGRSTRFTIGIPTLTNGVYGPQGPTAYVVDQLLAVRWPTSPTVDSVTYTFCAVGGEYNCMHEGVKKVTVAGVPWTYPATSSTGAPFLFIQFTANRPDGGSRSIMLQHGNSAAGPLSSYSDGIGLQTFYFEGSLSNRLTSVVTADGDTVSYLYDARGNTTQETHTPVVGSTLPQAITYANYDSVCSNALTCNKPNWIRDPKGNQTDFAYDPQHGGLLSVTLPPALPGSPRPQTRYTYVQRYAWYKNASGAVVQAASPIWVLSTSKVCRTSAALGSGCTIPGDEVTTTYEYGPTSGSNNLFVRGIAVTADGVTRRTCYGSDIFGNRISETSPKAGLVSCP
jgi:YD repeat-containing protein